MWQMKMAANAGGMAPHQLLERQSNYEYDPIAHGGYSTMEEYAPYQRLPQPAPVDYMRTSQNPSRQDYCSDPYASVHKPKKRMDQHMGEYLLNLF
jgi:echinoid